MPAANERYFGRAASVSCGLLFYLFIAVYVLALLLLYVQI